ncbi:MAG: S8 family serine peptidase [Vicinamibacterales bacterium]
MTPQTSLQPTVGIVPYNSTALGVPYEDGYGVGVAVIDSGIANRSDLAGRIVAFRDFTVNPAGATVPPVDGYGHGTHVAGIIAGNGALAGYNQAFQGVAGLTNLVGLRVLNAQGQGTVSNVVAAIQWAVANRAQ